MRPNAEFIDVPVSIMRPRTVNNRTTPMERVTDGAPRADDAAENLDGPASTSLMQLRLAVAELLHAVRNVLQDEPDPAQECLERAGALLRLDPSLTHLPAVQGTRSVEPIRGGLAPWQIRDVTTHIERHLDSTITIKDLAARVRLSSYHFCRAFRVSFGDSPHSYLMRRRVERAQGLMLTSKIALGQIAAACGLADQPHFNKLFRRFVGENPGAWRRARAVAPREVDEQLEVRVGAP